MSLPPGTRLGDYEIARPLGAGGMGEVYLARDMTLDRHVAVKILPADVTSDPQRVARFEREARAASALSQPNVCVIHALGSTSDGRRFIAMEYVEGHTLRERLSRQQAATLREALDIAIQLAAGIGAAHALGIVHRDLKPENVIVRADGLVKVLDFGLAKLTPSDSLAAAVDDPTRAHVSTLPGIVVGTVAYMSPEQVRGLEIDARTDVWSLGVILYELLTGRRPFAGTSGSDVMVGILDRDPEPLTRFDPRLPAELQRIVGKALRKDREQRYQVIKDLRLDLEALRDELQLQSRHGTSTAVPTALSVPAESVERHQSSAEYLVGQMTRHKIAVALTLVLVATLAGVAAWWSIRATRTDTAAQPAAAPVQRTLTRLTFGSGLQSDPTFSPDGRFVAYASDRSGNFDIWVQPVAGGEPVQVTRSSAHDTQPAWSPDGATLVFRSERDGGGLFVVPALGGVERQVTSFGTHPSWSPGSSRILFLHGIDPGEGSWLTRVYEVAIDEGAPRELLPDFLGRGDWFWIGRHPDGRVSAWGQHNQFGPGFYTLTLDGKRVVVSKEADGLPVRIHGGGSVVRRRFQWHRSGSTLFVQTQTDGVYNLWRVRVDPVSLAWTSADRLTTGAGAYVSPAISGDGTRLAFVTERQTSRATAFALGAGRQSLGPGRSLTEEDAMAELATISPDGRRLAYNLRRPGATNVELRLVSMDGGPSELIANDAIGPTWSRDGTSLVYNYFDLDKNPISARVALRQLGGHERFLSNWRNDFLFGPSYWTSDGLLGTRLPSSLVGDASLVLSSLDHLNAVEPDRVIASIPDAGLWQATVSPNGRWVSFVVTRTKQPGMQELMIAPAEGSPPDRFTRIAADHAWPDKPRWARDGRTLYFISRRPGPHFNLWAASFDPDRGVPVGKPSQLTEFDSPTLHVSSDLARAEMDVSATDVVLTMKAVSGSVWMLDGVDR